MTWCLTLQAISKEPNLFVLKTTGDEKCMVSICLAAKAYGTKLKPFVVFSATKRESKSHDEELESRCVVKSFGNT